jgi:hypothetical protein
VFGTELIVRGSVAPPRKAKNGKTPNST